MNYRDGDKIIWGERQLCAHLVQTYNEACHEDDTVRLAELCSRFGITESLQEPEAPKTPEQIAEELKQNIKLIEDARLRHLTDNIHPDALFMVREGFILGRPKASAFNAWCEALGLEMYHRIGLAENGQWDWSLLDFSTFPPKPCEVGEIWQEALGG